ncbi:hypothetical protein CDL15_Pgr021488 [Punica granatum]|uniref:Hyaluronan/mRNA-binding protein domain-containing protein n=2 Tax=Punica granatum TaxID=22663 RepID=A0A218XQ53_PUNGR|nr:hypothetical protein CDL15_Pgr021488 [Punica granatum]
MATMNPFDILGDADNEDPSQLVAAVSIEKSKKAPVPAAAAPTQQGKPAAKLPSKPLPPAQAGKTANQENFGLVLCEKEGVKLGVAVAEEEVDVDLARDVEVDAGMTKTRAPMREVSVAAMDSLEVMADHLRRVNLEGHLKDVVVGALEVVEAVVVVSAMEKLEKGSVLEGYMIAAAAPEEGQCSPRELTELKREGSGRGNWGTPSDEIAPEAEEAAVEVEKTVKQSGEEEGADANKENAVKEAEEPEPEPEEKEMTLEEYEKVLEEKRKALLAEKTEARKVELDKELKSMQQLANKKKSNDDVFIKLGSEKDKRKEAAEKEEKAKKSVSINEFLKPAEGEKYYNPGGRGRGRGRGPRVGGFGGGYTSSAAAPSIEDPGQFPTLGGK